MKAFMKVKTSFNFLSSSGITAGRVKTNKIKSRKLINDLAQKTGFYDQQLYYFENLIWVKEPLIIS